MHEEQYDYEHGRQPALEDEPPQNLMDHIRIVVPDEEIDSFVRATKPLRDGNQVNIVRSAFLGGVPLEHTAWDIQYLTAPTYATCTTVEAIIEFYGG